MDEDGRMSKSAVYIDDETGAILGRLAGERKTEPETILSQAIRLFDELHGQAALDELDLRWAEFERTKESYSREDVEAWLKTWGTRDYRPFRRRS
jgi:predicted transcriptional regulator